MSKKDPIRFVTFVSGPITRWKEDKDCAVYVDPMPTVSRRGSRIYIDGDITGVSIKDMIIIELTDIPVRGWVGRKPDPYYWRIVTDDRTTETDVH